MKRPVFDVTVVLVPGFSMMSLASVIEPMRIANRSSGGQLFRWSVVSIDGQHAHASNGLDVSVDHSLAEESRRSSRGQSPHLALVVAGLDIETFQCPPLTRWLRSLHRRSQRIGGISTAAYILADAGILDSRQCTLHWENLPAFAERFPTIEVRQELCVIDSNIYTCAGGTSAIDMMLHVIAEHAGQSLATAVADQLILPTVRPLDQRQRSPKGPDLRGASPTLAQAVKLMEESISSPISLLELPARLGMSRRQMERLFRRELSKSPAKYFLGLRLERGRHLLLQTQMPVIEIAIACGFVSASHFSRSFGRLYGRSPQAVRTTPGR